MSQAMRERDATIAELHSALQECKGDLERDEEIFASKMNEVAEYQRRIRTLNVQNDALTEKLVEVETTTQTLVLTVRYCVPYHCVLVTVRIVLTVPTTTYCTDCT
jgi:hypothetical protein